MKGPKRKRGRPKLTKEQLDLRKRNRNLKRSGKDVKWLSSRGIEKKKKYGPRKQLVFRRTKMEIEKNLSIKEAKRLRKVNMDNKKDKVDDIE